MSSQSENNPPSETTPHVVALLNQKGGVGKTTSTVNLGAAFARAGRRVCLIDLDPQGHLTLHLGVEHDGRTVYDLLIDPDCLVEDVVVRGARPNLDVILAEVDLAGAETELVNHPQRITLLRDRLAPIVDQYDVILIDCPPSLGMLTMNALVMATELFVPMQAHFLALQGVGRLLETVGLVCRSVNPDLSVTGIILCMHEAQTTLAREIVADLDSFFDAAQTQDVPWNRCTVLRPPIRRNIKLAEAPSFGNTIFDYAPWCPGALDYRKLASNLLAAWELDDAATPVPAEALEAKRAADDPDSPEALIREVEADVSGDDRIAPEVVVVARHEGSTEAAPDPEPDEPAGDGLSG